MKIASGMMVNVDCDDGLHPARILELHSKVKEALVVFVTDEDDPGIDVDMQSVIPYSFLRRFIPALPEEGSGNGTMPHDPEPDGDEEPAEDLDSAVVAPGPTAEVRPYVRRDIGFNQYAIKWDGTKFKFTTQDPSAEFYGQWRRTMFSNRVPGFAIDMWARYNHRDYAVESIYYTDDPREDARSLDGDLCAMANKFLWTRLSGNLDTLDDLQKRAEFPRIRITSLQSLDALIIRAREVRDTAITCGGQRYITIEGDDKYKLDPPGPTFHIEIDLTSEAILLHPEGQPSRVPPLQYGAMHVDSHGKRSATQITASKESIDSIIERLRSTQDPVEARRLRATLRKMGHKGGRRSSPSTESPEV